MSIRIKVILPYLLLTLVVAVTGVYVVTRLVANSLNERLTNQLLEAGRVVSDYMARQEIKHVEGGRIIAYTRGLPEALLSGDGPASTALAGPVTAGLGIENLILIDPQGWEIAHLILSSDGQLREISEPTGAGNSAIVQSILKSADPDSLPQRGLALDPTDERYYYFTAIPVPYENRIAGVVVVGTSLDTLLPYLKSTSLADVIVYSGDGHAIATTLGAMEQNAEALSVLTVPEVEFQEIMASNDFITGENFAVDGRWYSLARSALRVSNDRLGGFAVVLPLNYVLQAGSVSRNTYVLLFTVAMMTVILIGYFISRMIINPISDLVDTSKAIARGDLNKRTGFRSKDEIGELASTFDDMTQTLQQRTAELEKTNRILERMDSTKSSFINISAHELRTPLTVIQGYSQMVQEKARKDPDLAPLADGILEGAERMAEIIGNMLDVSRIDSNLLKVKPTELEIRLLVSKAHKAFKSALDERKMSFKTVGLEDLPLVPADPDLLYKAFYNLIMNAIKYTPDGGKITVSGHAVQNGSGREVEVAVADTGVGIDPEHRDLVFEKFYQTGEVRLHSSGKTKFKGGGPGLGLAIARGVVEAHRGRIWLESPGHDETKYPGTTFYVRLPAPNGREK